MRPVVYVRVRQPDGTLEPAVRVGVDEEPERGEYLILADGRRVHVSEHKRLVGGRLSYVVVEEVPPARPVLAEELADFEAMWTTDAHRYVLSGCERHGYVLIDISGPEQMPVLIDEHDELAAAVTRRMLEAGVPVVDPQDPPKP